MLETLLILALVGLLMFRLGYYLGNQMGRTEDIRDYLAETRQSRL